MFKANWQCHISMHFWQNYVMSVEQYLVAVENLTVQRIGKCILPPRVRPILITPKSRICCGRLRHTHTSSVEHPVDSQRRRTTGARLCMQAAHDGVRFSLVRLLYFVLSSRETNKSSAHNCCITVMKLYIYTNFISESQSNRSRTWINLENVICIRNNH